MKHLSTMVRNLHVGTASAEMSAPSACCLSLLVNKSEYSRQHIVTWDVDNPLHA